MNYRIVIKEGHKVVASFRMEQTFPPSIRTADNLTQDRIDEIVFGLEYGFNDKQLIHQMPTGINSFRCHIERDERHAGPQDAEASGCRGLTGDG